MKIGKPITTDEIGNGTLEILGRRAYLFDAGGRMTRSWLGHYSPATGWKWVEV